MSIVSKWWEKNTCKGGVGTILHHIRGKTNSIKGTSSDEGSDEERFSLRRPAFERFLHVREAGKAKIEAKKEEATNEICSTELRSGESTARLSLQNPFSVITYGFVAYMLARWTGHLDN